MVVECEVLADFEVGLGNECGWVIFCAVDVSTLEGSVDFATGHGVRDGFEFLHHFYGDWVLHDADDFAFEVCWGFDGVYGVEVSAAGIEVAEALEA